MSKVNTPPERMPAVTKQLAVELERSPDAVKTAIKSAREALAKRAEEYVDLHFMGAQKAVDRGDTRPVEWALEHISDGKDRVVDAPSKGQLEPGDKRPQIQIGIVLGGMPKPKGELPADATTVPIDVEVVE